MYKSSEKDRTRARKYYYEHRMTDEFKEKRKIYRRGLTANGYDKAWRLAQKVRVLLTPLLLVLLRYHF